MNSKPFLNKRNLFKINSPWVALYLSTMLFLSCSNDKKELKILFAGDLMLDRGVRNHIEKKGMNYLFEDIKPLFKSSDIVIVNFECVASNASLSPTKKKFTFRADPKWLSSLSENGITHVTLANNHSVDFGEEGIRQTVANLNHSGITPIGYYSDETSSCLPTIIKKNKSSIAIFSSCFLNQKNGFICNENATTLSERIKKFKEINPSTIVFACLHWGIEMELIPTIEQIAQAHHLINSGADVIIGHHPHVVQTIENYKGKYIFYSIGNFIFDNNREPANRGIFTEFSLSNGKIKSTKIIPFNIIKSKVKRMNTKESNLFMNEISTVSQTINFKQKNENWEIL